MNKNEIHNLVYEQFPQGLSPVLTSSKQMPARKQSCPRRGDTYETYEGIVCKRLFKET